MGNAAPATAAPPHPPHEHWTLDAEAARGYLRRCSWLVARHARALTRLDEALGDGDHGDNLLAGFAAIEGSITGDLGAEEDLSSLLRSVGTTLVASVGGASGPLYGSAFMEAGFVARGLGGMDRLPALSILLDAAASALARRGHCQVGDKTIYDTLAPAAAALRSAVARGDDDATAIRAMVRAAARGMRTTGPLVARRGLAMRLGERSRGHRDPGAASCMLLIRAFAGGSRDR